MAVFDIGAILADVSRLDTGNRPQLEYIHIDELVADEKNFYELDGIYNLASNIELVGLQQPIRVRKNEFGTFTIVSGHRRHAALHQLVAEGKSQFAQVPCLVDNHDESPEMAELRLIYGNSDTRQLSAADLMHQAERVESLLSQLSGQGVNFPGRMRDHVANACQTSASKLARLKVIREKAASPILKLFETGKIGETVAYAFAQAPKEKQLSIHEWFHDSRICEMTEKDVLQLTRQSDPTETPKEDAKPPRQKSLKNTLWRLDKNYPEGQWIAFLFDDDDEPEVALVHRGKLIWDGLDEISHPIRGWYPLPPIPRQNRRN